MRRLVNGTIPSMVLKIGQQVSASNLLPKCIVIYDTFLSALIAVRAGLVLLCCLKLETAKQVSKKGK